MTYIDTNTRGQGHRLPANKRWRIAGSILAGATVLAGSAIVFQNDAYQDNLQMIRSASVRNVAEDNSPHRDEKQAELVQANHLGPRSDYLSQTNGNPEQAFPIAQGGQFRTACEFSHFAYDDPILFPDQPGAAHLHMFFGNTDTNAHTTQETLEDAGGSTCNGQELNRSGYWAPAMFDGQGNVRTPERIVVYYKGEGRANGGEYPDEGSLPYKRGHRNIAPNPQSVPEVSNGDGGASGGEVNYKCADNFSGGAISTGINNIPVCDGSHYNNLYGPATYPGLRVVLEMEIKFWNCWDPNHAATRPVTEWQAWKPAGTARGVWFYSNCDGDGGGPATPDYEHYPNMSYFVNYVVEPGETTANWFLSSDVNAGTIGNAGGASLNGPAGAGHHGDVWWEWQDETNQQWLDNCVNYSVNPTPSGCGFGYLTDGGPNNSQPFPGPALKYRQDFDTPGTVIKYPVSQLFAELCQPLGPSHTLTNDASAGYCKP